MLSTLPLRAKPPSSFGLFLSLISINVILLSYPPQAIVCSSILIILLTVPRCTLGSSISNSSLLIEILPTSQVGKSSFFKPKPRKLSKLNLLLSSLFSNNSLGTTLFGISTISFL